MVVMIMMVIVMVRVTLIVIHRKWNQETWLWY
jgi:hypothetical protein